MCFLCKPSPRSCTWRSSVCHSPRKSLPRGLLSAQLLQRGPSGGGGPPAPTSSASRGRGGPRMCLSVATLVAPPPLGLLAPSEGEGGPAWVEARWGAVREHEQDTGEKTHGAGLAGLGVPCPGPGLAPMLPTLSCTWRVLL